MFPLFFKHGQTLGKKALKLGVTTRHGYTVTVPWLLLRYFAFLFINLLSNLLIPIILPFISLTIMTFSKERRSAHDFIANTKVIDLQNSTVYKSEAEFLEAQKDIVLDLRLKTLMKKYLVNASMKKVAPNEPLCRKANSR